MHIVRFWGFCRTIKFIFLQMKRDIYWDSLKYILIFLVVYGHVIRHYTTGSPFNMATYNFIFMFHMPLFIFVSGRFSHIRDRQRYKKGIIRLFETFIIFQIIRTAIPLLHGGKLTSDCFTTPNWILWYLVALIYWRLMVYFIPEKWLKHRKRIVAISICISLLAGFIPIGHPFVVQRTLAFLPFFVIGYYSKDFDIKSHINKIPPIAAIVVLCAAFCILFFTMNINLSFVHHCSFPYWANDMSHTFLRFVARCVFIPSSLILCVMVMRIVPAKTTLAKWGNATMFIYIYHSFAVNFLDAIIHRNILPRNAAMLFVYSVIITFGLLLLSRFKPLNILLNPITHYKDKCSQKK